MLADIQKSTVASLDSELRAAGDGVGQCRCLAQRTRRLRRLHQDSRPRRPPAIHERGRQARDGSRGFRQAQGLSVAGFLGGRGQRGCQAAVAIAECRRHRALQGAANTAKGTPRYWDVQVSPILGDDGKPRICCRSRATSPKRAGRGHAEGRRPIGKSCSRGTAASHQEHARDVGAIANQTMRGADVTRRASFYRAVDHARSRARYPDEDELGGRADQGESSKARSHRIGLDAIELT